MESFQKHQEKNLDILKGLAETKWGWKIQVKR